MNQFIIMAVLVLGLALAALFRGVTRVPRGPKSYRLANIGEGVHKHGLISQVADAAITVRFSLVTFGATASSVKANITSTIPIGIAEDVTDSVTNDLTIPLRVGLLGSAAETKRLAINSTVARGDWLIADTTTFIYGMTDPATASSLVYRVGHALQAGVAGDVIEIDPLPGFYQH